MKHKTRTPLILILCLLSFFSCKPTDIIVPKELNALELKAKLATMPEFHEYWNAKEALTRTLVEQIHSLTKEQALWVTHIHQKYPSPEIFVEKAETNELTLYKELTGLAVSGGNEISDSPIQHLIFTLSSSATYHPEDLALVLLPQPGEKLFGKFSSACERYCWTEAARKQKDTYDKCSQFLERDQTFNINCAQIGLITFNYYLVECLISCIAY